MKPILEIKTPRHVSTGPVVVLGLSEPAAGDLKMVSCDGHKITLTATQWEQCGVLKSFLEDNKDNEAYKSKFTLQSLSAFIDVLNFSRDPKMFTPMVREICKYFDWKGVIPQEPPQPEPPAIKPRFYLFDREKGKPIASSDSRQFLEDTIEFLTSKYVTPGIQKCEEEIQYSYEWSEFLNGLYSKPKPIIDKFSPLRDYMMNNHFGSYDKRTMWIDESFKKRKDVAAQFRIFML